MEDIVVTRAMLGIFSMQVCAVKDATDEQVLEVCNRENPAGTTNGWAYVVREDREEEGVERGPVQCVDHEDRFHLIIDC